jgi:hypothetical protein
MSDKSKRKLIWLSFIKNNKEYCYCCLEERGDKDKCCNQSRFVPFYKLTEDQQDQLVESWYPI